MLLNAALAAVPHMLRCALTLLPPTTTTTRSNFDSIRR